uniref:Putative tnf receptor-associated factor ixodes scapularis tnf receptor-associated factor n=1 Tax=Amblyomma triste TaxID=251400 RepID=A0A023GBZ9_AMBTT
MTGTEYTLTGFDDFLERRRIVFMEPLPITRVCGICGVVSCRSLLLPCGHVLCQFCKDQISEEDVKCPLDDIVFAETEAVPVTFNQSLLEQHQVFCVAGGKECSFAGKLRDLKEHLNQCGSDKVRCVKCHLPVARNVAVEHYRQCSAEASLQQCVSVAANTVAAEKLGSMKQDLETIREWASSEKVDQDAVLNAANSLLERMACLEHDLTDAYRKASEDQSYFLSAQEKATFTPGPYRPTSKHGNFIVACKFPDIYTGNAVFEKSDRLLSCGYTLSSEICVLAGYTFKVDCRFSRTGFGGDITRVKTCFTLWLVEGAWDICVEWPFSKKVSLILTHTTCTGKDITLPLLGAQAEPLAIAKKAPGHPSTVGSTEEISWSDIARQGLLVNSALYVNVEFE